MGKLFGIQPDPWSSDPKYIVNLATNIFGKTTLKALASERVFRNGPAFLNEYCLHVERAVHSMSDETLGRICGYGRPRGADANSVPGTIRKTFISVTGYKNVITYGDVSGWTLDLSQKSGRDLMEELAILTIICVARDVIMQPQLKTNNEESERFQFMRSFSVETQDTRCGNVRYPFKSFPMGTRLRVEFIAYKNVSEEELWTYAVQLGGVFLGEDGLNLMANAYSDVLPSGDDIASYDVFGVGYARGFGKKGPRLLLRFLTI